MSAVPPNLVGPLLQSHMMQRQASNIRDNEESQKATASRQQGTAADEKDNTVETTDNDTQVHTDAEGTGSQGRTFSESPEQQEETPPTDLNDEDNGGHLIDIQA
jgi:hypothetical protein